MLGKLLKHDFNATKKMMLGLFAGTILIILAGFLIKLIDIDILKTFYIFAAVIVCAASLAMPYIIMIWRYYTNFFSREGYLTRTIPVNKSQIYFAKLIMSLIWLVCGIISFVCVLMIIFHVTGIEFKTVYETIDLAFSIAFGSAGLKSFITYMISVGSVQIIMGITAILFAITAANLPAFINNNKLMAVVIYYVASMAISIVETGAMLLIPFSLDMATGKIGTTNMLSNMMANSIEEVPVFGMGTVITDAILAVVFIFLTLQLLKKKTAVK